MKITKSIFFIICFGMVICGQSTSSHVDEVKVYSQNEKYYIHTIPYDNYDPSLKGRSRVFEKGNDKPLYELNRGFDTNRLFLSNNGEILIALNPYFADEDVEGLRSVSIYKKGKLIKDFTSSVITGCDETKERCDIAYYNRDIVVPLTAQERLEALVNPEKAVERKTKFQEWATEEDIFLYHYEIFSHEDTLYLTDSKKKTHLFDIAQGKYIGYKPFERMYPLMKKIARDNKIESESYETPYNYDFPVLSNGKDTETELAKHLGMKVVKERKERESGEFRIYMFEIFGTVFRDGSFKVDKIDSEHKLLNKKIREFFDSNKFDTQKMPKVFEQFYIYGNRFDCRHPNDDVSRKESKAYLKQLEEERKKWIVAEEIRGVYIPRDLEDSFIHLDKMLKEIDKTEIRNASERELALFHMGIGLWMRNNWRFWGVSRFQQYFIKRGIIHPDNMSGIVINLYHKWLNGKKDVAKDWEQKNPVKIKRINKS